MAKHGVPMGMGGMGGGNMMKQIQKMQADMMRTREEMEGREYQASSGGGVTVTVNGKHEITSLVIAPEAIDPEDAEMLCDMVMVACNEALRKAGDATEKEMGRFTGGLNLPF